MRPPSLKRASHEVTRQWRTIRFHTRKGHPAGEEQRMIISCTCGFEDCVDSEDAAERSVQEHKLDVLLATAGIEFNVYERPNVTEAG